MLTLELTIDAGYWLRRLASGDELLADDRAQAARVLTEVFAIAQTARPPRPSDAPEETRARQRRSRAHRAQAVPPVDAPEPAENVTPVTTVTRDARDTSDSVTGSPSFPPSPLPLHPNPTPSLPPSPGLLAAGRTARDAGSSGDEPAADVAAWATALTVAANQGITAALGEQTRPIRAAAQHLAAADIRAIGLPLTAARAVVRQLAEEAARRGHAEKPRGLGYFVAAIREAHEAVVERDRARETPEPDAGGAPRAAARRAGGRMAAAGAAGQQAYDTALAVATAMGGRRPQ